MSKKGVRMKLPGDLSSEDLLGQIIRVNQAGEYGAKRIYEGQLAVLKNGKKHRGDDEVIHAINEMKEQELKHLKYFNEELMKRKMKATIFQPIWHVAGWTLGAITAKLGTKAAMACTVAVEEVIDEHYQEQIDSMIIDEKIKKNEENLINTIKQFREEELEHRDKGLEYGAEDTIGYSLMSKAIKKFSRIAIWLSKRH